MKDLFTKESKLLMDFLLSGIDNNQSKELKDLYDFFTTIPLKEVTTKMISELYSNQKNIIVSNFASKSIIRKSQDIEYSNYIILQIDNIEIFINIYHNNDINLKEFINNLKTYIQFIVSLKDTNKKKIILNLYLLDSKKFINSKIPKKEEINSGSCLNKDENHSIIYIWRKEEILKTTLHELIHALKFTDYLDTQELINHYKIRYNISSRPINTDEAYTEIWANLINCFLISQKVNTQKKKLFYQLVSFEKSFCKFQAEKIIYHTGISNKSVIDINKNTNVFSYYILRMELYNNLLNFLKYCRENNEGYLNLLNTDSWLVFLKNNKKIKKNNRRFNKINNTNYIYKTLRFSACEIDTF